MERPVRKKNRLPSYDYTQAGYYFVTVCTVGRRWLLRRGAQCAPGFPSLTKEGDEVEWAIMEISAHYPNVHVDKYVIMPNHIHFILVIAPEGGRPQVAPTVSRVIQQFKGAVTKRLGRSIWQKSFHDHIIRNQSDYLRIHEYIETNPARWVEDCYYKEE